MKQHHLFSIGAFLLVLTLSGLMTGCMEKDVYDPTHGKDPLPDPDEYFGFKMRGDVKLFVNYDISGFTPLIEIYGENPMETVEGTPVKKEGIEALFKTYTDNKGKYEGEMQLPTYLDKVYLYTATWGLPRCIELEIKDNAVSFDMSAKSDLKQRFTTRASSDVPYEVKPNINLYSLCSWGEGGSLSASYMSIETTVGDESILNLTDRMKTFFAKGDQDNSYLVGNRNAINISVKEAATLDIVFLNRDAEFNNTFGYYYYKTGTSVDVDKVKKYIVFPNVSFSVHEGQLPILKLGSKVRLLYFNESTGQASETFPAGYTVGYFIYANGFASNYEDNLGDYINVEKLLTSNPKFNSPSFVSVKDKKSGKTIVGAEDRENLSYCDLLFYVDATPEKSIEDPNRPVIPDDGKEDPKPDADENLSGTLAFEDIWPSGGDYDMNDVMVEYERNLYFNQKNVVTKIVDIFTPVHNGATYTNAFAYQVDAAQLGDKLELPEGAILEKETNSIIVMPNAKLNIGKKYVVTREFNGAFKKDELVDYNPYIIVNYSQGQQSRTEVHLPKHKATSFADMSLIGSNDDAYYIKRDGEYPFAIDIPILNFTPATERRNIDIEYPDFATWADSKGQKCKDWYKK